MSARQVPADEWNERAVPARERVFHRLDAYDEPFTDSAPVRALLFPISYQLEPPQMSVLKDAAKSVGDASIFLESLEATTPDHATWEFSVEGEGPYDAIEFVLVNATFSPSGRWGLIISEEDHAVIGGVPEFMGRIANKFPATAEPTRHFFASPESPLDNAPPDASIEEMVALLASAGEQIPVRSGAAFGDEQGLAFTDYWKNFRDPERGIGDWVEGLFVHIYGEQHAHRLLEVGGWS
jgi:hypothetical protein